MRGVLKVSMLISLVWLVPCHAATTVIHAGHLIAEPGKPPLDRRSIVIEDGRITAVREGFVAGDAVVDLSDAWVMPGLIDMHSHITVTMDMANPVADFLAAYTGRSSARALSTLPRVRAALHNGFTTLRNLGDPASVSYDLGNAIEAGIVEGPRLIASEPQFGVPGGDYEAFLFGARAELEGVFRSRGTCAGVTDCERVVREEVRRGAGVIKLRLYAQPMISPGSGPMETPEEIAAIVRTAHRLNRKVAAHSAGDSVANQLVIDAGVDTIEHGPLNDANIAGMAARGIAYTPTLLAAKITVDAGVPGMPRDYYAKAVESVRKARSAGVPILFGSDTPVVPLERAVEEFQLLTDAGLSPDEALATATVNAAVALGLEETMGSIAPGKIADLIALQRDPRSDLAEMKEVFFVMKGGKVVREDAMH